VNTADKNRKLAKVRAVSRRLDEIGANRDLLLNMLDETKLDLLILALGIGAVELSEQP
jgi:hypothetical protein